jgi:hypothetical protein
LPLAFSPVANVCPSVDLRSLAPDGHTADVAADRQRLRATFDEDAHRYDRARPTYPAAVFDEIDRRVATTAPRRSRW